MRRKTLRTALAFLFIALAGVVLASMRRGDTSNAQAEMERYLERIVSVLAGDIGERNCYRPENLSRTIEFISEEFERLGYEVRTQDVIADDPSFKCATPVSKNIIAELPGTTRPEEILVVGAHYDTKVAMHRWNAHREPLPELPGTPGADDNASGVAATLLLAKLLADEPQERTIRFVAFANEEPPFFQHPTAMGSWVYARKARKNNDDIIAMISLETLGVYSKHERTKLPLFRFIANRIFLSSRSDYVAFLGNRRSRNVMAQAADAFKENSSIRLRTLAFPAFSRSVAWSDDWSFWQEGYRAFSVTDTAYLRHDHYHELTDTADRLDYAEFAQVVRGVHAAVLSLARSPS